MKQMLGDDTLCSCHAKIVPGLVTTTRGDGRAIPPIRLPMGDTHP